MTITTKRRVPTIVYVEDNDGDAVLLEEALQTQGHEVQLLVIADGESALHYFKVKEHAKDLPPPHCILLDDHLPLVSGGHLLKFLRASPVYDKTPIYLFSQASDFHALILDETIRRKCFLQKPDGWPQFLELADFLMRSAEATKDENWG